MGHSLGFIETRGLSAAIAAADAMVKAADVKLKPQFVKIGSGYVTTMIEGEVGAVKAAVESGRTAAEGLGEIISVHVIARPSDDVYDLFFNK